MPRSTKPKPGAPGRVYTTVLLAAIAAAGLALSFYLYAGPSAFYDDSVYLLLAHYILSGNPSFIGNIFGFDFLQLFPVAIYMGIFGYGSLQAIAGSITEYIAIILLSFVIGRRVAGDWCGLIASFVASMTPFVVVNVTRVLPDMATGMAAGISLYMFLACTESRRRYAPPVLFGALTVLPFFMKTEGMAFLGFAMLGLLAVLVYDRTHGVAGGGRAKAARARIDTRFFLLACAGMVAALFLYFMVFYLLINNPFFGLEHFVIAPVQTPANNIIAAFNPDTFYLNNNVISDVEIYPMGLILYMAIAGTVTAFFIRNRNVSYLAFVNWGVFAYLVAGTTSYHSYVPITTHTRFFTIILVPLAVLCAYFLVALYQLLRRRAGRYAGAVAVLALLALFLYTNSPIYSAFKVTNGFVSKDFALFYDLTDYIRSMPSFNGINYYVYGATGFNLFTMQDLEFATGYNASDIFYVIDVPVYPYNNSLKCYPWNVTDKTSYLVEAYPLGYPDIGNATERNITAWMGRACSISFERDFVDNSTGTRLYLYRLTAVPGGTT